MHSADRRRCEDRVISRLIAALEKTLRHQGVEKASARKRAIEAVALMRADLAEDRWVNFFDDLKPESPECLPLPDFLAWLRSTGNLENPQGFEWLASEEMLVTPDTPNAVRQFPLQDGIHRKTQVPDQQQMWNALALSLDSVVEQVRRQAGRLDDLLGTDVLQLGLGGIGRLRVAFGLRRMSHSARDTLTISKDRRPVLGALAFKLEDGRLVVTDVLKQLVPDRPLAIEAPAPEGFQADLPAEGKLPLGHHGVCIFISKTDAPMTTLFNVEAKFRDR